jgi:DNA-binding transcriptional LysR family regulator
MSRRSHPYTLSQLRAFHDVAATLSFTQSARRLHLTQPALSASVRKLETTIGSPLFYRERQRVQLTQAGRELLPLARRVIEQAQSMEQAVDRLSGRQGACLRVQIASALFSVSSYGRLQAFRRAYPDVRLEIDAFACDRSLQDILSGRVDVIYGPALPHPDVELRIIRRAGVLAVLPPGHRFAAQPRLRWSMVLGEPLLLLSAGEGLTDFLREALEGHGWSLTIGQTIARLESLVSLVRAGLGIGVISAPVGAWLGCGQVHVVPLEEPTVSVPMAVGRLATRGHAPMVQRLFECLARAA